MTYYVIYQEYTEYNQFEGEWFTDYHSFDTLQKAATFIGSCERSSWLRFVAGPLIKIEKKDNE